jgi:transposase
MMGRQSGQLEMIVMDLSELIPEGHLLKAIDRRISFEFIYELMAPLYANRGRPSVDPVSVVKMLLVGYLYGIKSERRLTEQIGLSIAYRWFCGFRLTDKIPDHSLFSQNRKRKWGDSRIFEEVFFEVVRACMMGKTWYPTAVLYRQTYHASVG